MPTTATPLPDGSVLAALDLGSNSFHLIVARLEHGEILGGLGHEAGRRTDAGGADDLALPRRRLLIVDRERPTTALSTAA